MRGFLRIVLFVVVGPYIGLLAMSLLIGFYTLATTGSARDFVFGPELVAPGILIFVYAIGGGPALLSGIVAIFVARRAAGWRYWLWMGLAGGVLSLALLLAIGGPAAIGANGMLIEVMIALAGVVAAFACAMLFDGLAALLARAR